MVCETQVAARPEIIAGKQRQHQEQEEERGSNPSMAEVARAERDGAATHSFLQAGNAGHIVW